jgi:hypothetical protein
MITLEEKLNVICDSLANGTIACYLSNGMERKEGPQFLPFKKAAVILNGVKLTTDISAKVQF